MRRLGAGTGELAGCSRYGKMIAARGRRDHALRSEGDAITRRVPTAMQSRS
jgi:hypothetical protein